MRTLHHSAQIYYPETRQVFIRVELCGSFTGLGASHSRLTGLWQVAVPAEADDVDAGLTALGAFQSVFDTVHPCALDIYVYDASMKLIELD